MVASFINWPLLTSVLLSSQASFGAVIHQNLDSFPTDIKFDFIVAGGGAGGTLVVSRLAENPDWNVLLVEAGGSNNDFEGTRVPGLWLTLQKSSIDWNYTTIPQIGLNNRSVDYPRGKVLGGCTSHNAMLYTRGSKGEWDRYAEIGGSEGLRWDNMLPLLKKAEKLTHDLQNHSDVGHYEPAFHGTKGQLFTQAPYSDRLFNNLMIQGSKELSKEFPFNRDFNDGTVIGTSWNQFTIDSNSERSSGATAFLGHTGNNVHILLNTQVTRVTPVGPNDMDFRVAEVSSSANGTSKRVIAEKDVILSSGVFGTPHILLHSGIGDREELEAAGVTTVVDNPSVGKNITDHVLVLTSFSAHLQKTSFNQDAALKEWETTRTGPLARPFGLDQLSFIRLAKDAPPFDKEGFHDPSPSKDSAHVEFLFRTIVGPETSSPGINSTLQVDLLNLHPVSRGSVTIQNSNPFDYPSIDIGLLAEKIDVSILREGFRSMRRLLSAPAFQGSVFGSVNPPANVTSDEDLEDFLRNAGSSADHPVGSASMSPKGANWGVVDPDFRVKGTTGLRVVDASIIPFLPSGHTQVPVYGFAEWASIVITRNYL